MSGSADPADLAGSHAGPPVRLEIQGLRAIAVSLVLVFHVWPGLLPGGFVGVDVFFVISGYLITGLLIRESQTSGTVNLIGFYLRRARRLLPIALFVIWITALLTPVLLPPSQWKTVAFESVASAFYFENWYLSALSVDYLGAEEAPSPLQHYWSLSVEEQFYLFWPMLVIVCAWIARRRASGIVAIALPVFIGVSALSLALSVMAAQTSDPSAYFHTQTRIWQLGLGAILAVATPSLGDGTRRLCGVIGLVAIFASAVLFSATTRFPGYAALLPTVGAALVILSGSSAARFSPYRLLSTRPFQFLGSISYSAYLWHWPLVVFWRTSSPDGTGPVEGMALIAATLLLSVASKRFIEDRFRSPWDRRALQVAAAPVAALTVLSAGLWGWVWSDVQSQKTAAETSPQNYPGALSLVANVPTPEGVGLAPPLALVRFDKAAAYDNGCHLDFGQTEPVACRYGDPRGAFKVLLIGDSHAANWIPALEAIATRRHWNAASYTKSSCPMISITLRRGQEPYDACREWGRKMEEVIARERPDLIMFAQMAAAAPWGGSPDDAGARLQSALIDTWSRAAASGARVVVIADTPGWTIDPDACLFRDRDCAFRPGLAHDPLVSAAAASAVADLIDLNSFVCPDGVCHAVIGNVIVWRDRHHLTSTYSRSLSALLESALDEAVKSDTVGMPMSVSYSGQP